MDGKKSVELKNQRQKKNYTHTQQHKRHRSYLIMKNEWGTQIQRRQKDKTANM